MVSELPELGHRIRDLRIKRQLTQGELGLRIGRTGATINKYETGVVSDLPRPVVEALAEALDCDPGYLMLWYDDPDGPTTHKQATDLALTEEEEEFLRVYRSLPFRLRVSLLQEAYRLAGDTADDYRHHRTTGRGKV